MCMKKSIQRDPKKMVQIDFGTHILFQGNFAAQYFNSNSIPVSGYTWESRNQKDSGILSDISNSIFAAALQ